MEVIPTGKALGAEICGIDLSKPLSDEQMTDLRYTWDKHLVLFSRGQDLSDPALMEFSRNFGELDPPGPNPYGTTFLPEFPEINVISNVKNDAGQPIGNLGDGEAVWHMDMTYIDTPPKGAILHGWEVPVGQGDTYFSNLFEAYKDMPEDLRKEIEGRKCIHDAAHNSAGMLRKGYEENDDPRKTPGPHHPLVMTDPVSGRKSLMLGRRPHAYIVGLEPEESEDLLDRIWEHATQPKYTWGHKWQKGDLLMWQNLWVLHRRDSFDPNSRRVLHRTQIKGEMTVSA